MLGVTDTTTGQPIGIAALFGQCAARQKALIQHGIALVNAYADLGQWWHFTPLWAPASASTIRGSPAR
jgi:hypothetical protein